MQVAGLGPSMIVSGLRSRIYRVLGLGSMALGLGFTVFCLRVWGLSSCFLEGFYKSSQSVGVWVQGVRVISGSAVAGWSLGA